MRLVHTAAGIGVALWVAGAILLFAVPGGRWSDVPGGALLALGVGIELACAAAILLSRLRSR